MIKRRLLRFEGVERAYYVWLNDHFVGFAEDSFSAHEFDVTALLKPKNNHLVVAVVMHSTASWLEDQDMFRFAGIFRSVQIVNQPVGHVVDFTTKTDYVPSSHEGIWALSGRFLTQPAWATFELTDSDERVVWHAQTTQKNWHFPCQKLANIKPWSHHTPQLYTLTIKSYCAAETVAEVVRYQVGFRHLAITADKVVTLNGKRLVIAGVNRHEWSATTGRTISVATMKQDIRLFLENNINAVRTSHYPNQNIWYHLCDQNGIYVMAETNLETHGTWQKMGQVEPSFNVPASLNQWQAAVLDRAYRNYHTLKNHPAILFWSLGNESYAGSVLAEMDKFYHAQHDGRLTHYEGVVHTPALKNRIYDVESWMYLAPDKVADYLAHAPQKPLLLCEYMHSMGNSVGGLGEYMQLLSQYPQFVGGFIWDWVDQALLLPDPILHQVVPHYGGDFDDRHADNEFSADGLLFCDRTPKPALSEVKYYYGKFN